MGGGIFVLTNRIMDDFIAILVGANVCRLVCVQTMNNISFGMVIGQGLTWVLGVTISVNADRDYATMPSGHTTRVLANASPRRVFTITMGGKAIGASEVGWGFTMGLAIYQGISVFGVGHTHFFQKQRGWVVHIVYIFDFRGRGATMTSGVACHGVGDGWGCRNW